ncbi:MAG: hypothetical protein H6867_04905 [Rhodospirillales bacterium]|nr:hypothetical protein [Rhodospirillales bacterium]MCB9994840.1 hypothetical protein [Rhodospirillales bacterium]
MQDKYGTDLKEQVKDRVRLEDVAALRVHGGLKRHGKYYKGLCPFHPDRNPSFYINTQTNRYRCYACDANGDAIQFLMDTDNLTFKEALQRLAEMCGIIQTPGRPAILKKKAPPRPLTDAEQAATDLKEINKARDLYKSSVPAQGTVIETYLKCRSIDPALLPAGVMRQLRFLPEVPYWHTWKNSTKPTLIGKFPAMVAPMQDKGGAIRGVHITYLQPDGRSKVVIQNKDKPNENLPAKKMKGRPWGCAIRLGPPAPTMVFSEGIENGLSSLFAKPEWPVWVAGSLGNLAGAGENKSGEPHPLNPDRYLPTIYPSLARPGMVPPSECKTAVLLAENDAGDQYAVNALVERILRRWDSLGLEARAAWSPAGKDHNDILREETSDN